MDFVVVLILFHNAPLIGGWTVHEVAFLYGLSAIAFGLADLLVGHVENLPQLVREGSFDLLLVRPRGSLFQLLASDFVIRRVGRCLQGCAVFGWALANLDVAWTPGRVAMVPVAVL